MKTDCDRGVKLWEGIIWGIIIWVILMFSSTLAVLSTTTFSWRWGEFWEYLIGCGTFFLFVSLLLAVLEFRHQRSAAGRQNFDPPEPGKDCFWWYP
jgi:uncharacterized membrane protein YagU involved in acid resistance